MANTKKEMSAIDAVYKILSEIEKINARLDVIDANIKLLNNRIKSSGVPAGKASAKPPTATAPSATAVMQTPIGRVIKVFGRVKNQREKPLKGVYIKIYSSEGKVIKSRETDADGYWEARLELGSYGVEYIASHINKKFRPINKTIVLDETMNEYEVK